LGTSYDSFYYFKFNDYEDAEAFAEATPKEIPASHFFFPPLMAPCLTKVSDECDEVVICTSNGYGTFDLSSFNRNNVVSCTVVVYECHSDGAFAYNLDADEFTYGASAPDDEENWQRGYSMLSDESMPHYNKDDFDAYEKLCDAYIEYKRAKFNLEVEMLRR
jgi:hypothetical protein